jgi:Spy/CpxP family protein refolding chaperone
MKPWIKRSLIAAFVASVLAGGLAACSPRSHHGWGAGQVSAEDAARWREKLLARAGKELQLDEAQQQKLGVVFDRLREQRNAFVGSTPNPRAELSALVSGERFDQARAQALIDQKTQAIRAGSPQTIAALADFYDSLKPEQQARLRELLDKRGRGGWRS